MTQNNYDSLTKSERRSVFLRAIGRGDAETARTVVKNSPRIEVRVVDFSEDLDLLRQTMFIHLLGQTSLITAVRDCLENRENVDNMIKARLLSTHYVVYEEAWRIICTEYGFDYEGLLVGWSDFLPFNYTLALDYMKQLAVNSQTVYKYGDELFRCKVPAVEDQLKEYRQMLAR